MIDCFFGLRHHTIIRGHNQDNDIGHSGTTSTHCRKCFVPGSIQECNFLTIKIDIVSTDMLSNPASFTLSYIGFANCIKQAGFTMINVTHDGDNRRANLKIFRFVFHLFGWLNFKNCLFIKSDIFNFMIKLRG